MIRKTLILGVLALVGVAAAAPALTGLYLAREFDGVVDRLDARPGVHVVSSRFTRGWLQSDARIRLRLDDRLCSQAPCPGVTLDTVIYHGPVPFGAPVDPDTGLQPALAVAVTRIDPESLWPRLVFDPPLSPLRLVTRIGFDSRARTQLHANGANVDVSRERTLAHLEMSAVTGRVETALRGGRSSGALDWPQFRIVGEAGGQLGWCGLALQGGEIPGEADADNDADGRGQQLRAESMRLADGLGDALLLQDMVFQLQPLPAPASRASARFDIHVSKIALDNRPYGPLILQGSVENVVFGAMPSADTPASGIAGYGARLLRRLAGGGALDIDRLLLATPRGDIRGHLHLTGPGAPRAVRVLSDVLDQLDIDLAIRLPVPLARDLVTQAMLAQGRAPATIAEDDVDAVLDALAEHQLVERVDHGHGYRVRLVAGDRGIRLNGRAQPGWSALIGRFNAARERL